MRYALQRLRLTATLVHLRAQEGTPFDMTLGMAAGPFGSPDRFGGPAPGSAVAGGGWERTIATRHTIVSLVIEARAWLPDAVGGTLWFAPHAAHTSAYAPFPCGMDALPPSYANSSGWGAPNPRAAAWANRAVFAAAQGRFADAVVQVRAARGALDNASLALQASTDAAYAAGTTGIAEVGALFRANADAIVAGWWELHDQLIYTTVTNTHYPDWWISSPDVNYAGGPASASPASSSSSAWPSEGAGGGGRGGDDPDSDSDSPGYSLAHITSLEAAKAEIRSLRRELSGCAGVPT